MASGQEPRKILKDEYFGVKLNANWKRSVVEHFFLVSCVLEHLAKEGPS